MRPPETANEAERGEWVFEGRGWEAYGCLMGEYVAEESFFNDYLVWDVGEQSGYFPSGTYRFRERITTRETGQTSEESEFTWGFSVRVEDVE